MNFGQRVSLIGDEPFAPIKSDFLLIQKIPIEQRFCSDISIKSQTEPEAIMLVGLPGVGKTEWAIKYSKLNPSKSFCIIGMSTILNKMKNIGKKPSNTELATVKSKDDKNSNDESKIDKKDDCKTEKNESNGKSNSSHILVAKSQMELLDKVLKCMNVLIDIAAQANRNVLIDQPNIYESTRRRKIKIFEKYKCRAVVILPSYETYNEKLSTNEQISNESFTNLINDMKANFSLPEPGELFESVEYVGSVKEEAEKLVERYNKQGVENRLNLIVEKRNKKKLATKQTVSRVLGHQSVGYNKFGPRFHNSPMQVMYPNDIGYRNRFNVNPMNNKRFIGNNYYNQPIRMNGRIPTNVINPMIPGYARPSMIISNGIQSGFQNIGMPPRYNLMQPHQTPQYNLNHSWPAATSTELWNQQRMSSVTSSNSNWAPALPVSGQNHQNLMVNMIPNNSSGSQRPSWPTNNSPGNNGSVVDSWPAANQTH